MTKTVRILIILLFLCAAQPLWAAEVKNVTDALVGNRGQLTYDLVGKEAEVEVGITITVGGKEYRATDLHLTGNLGKVKPGRGKIVWWNILRDFPQGLDTDVVWSITAGDSMAFTYAAMGMEFVFVKGGCFEMGDTSGDNDEKPVHNVCVADFYLGKYKVTQGQWQKIMENNPSRFDSCGDNCPVEQLRWADAQDFIKKLNAKTGKRYRLPTEAEWEYAARSGGKREQFSGSDSPDGVAWYDANSGGKTHPVGQKRPNGLGLYDMSGNIWEWCQDWYGEKYYGESPRDNPQGPSSGDFRVLRGGSFDGYKSYVRTTSRNRIIPWHKYAGFRFALSVP
jgi:formylglycine-generating enzyme required for sulfatase activity